MATRIASQGVNCLEAKAEAMTILGFLLQPELVDGLGLFSNVANKEELTSQMISSQIASLARFILTLSIEPYRHF